MSATQTINFNHLLREIQLPLFQFVFSLIPHKHDAEDILQKTNLILVQKQEEFDPKKGSIKSWAFSIARYQVMAHKSKHGRSKIYFSNELTEVLADESVDYHTTQMQQNALNKCYNKLPEHMQKIAYLRFKQSKSLQEISNSTQRSMGAVSATLHRIRANLMKCIHNAYNEAEQEYYR